jgi:glutaredoxin
MKISKLFKKKQVVVYTSSTCGYCKSTKKELNENDINYVEKDIKENESEWNELVRLTNMPITPAIVYGENYLFPSRDFPNPQILVKILKDLKDVKHSNSLQSLERIKTLNYHISTAFSQLQKTLKQIETKLNPEENDK